MADVLLTVEQAAERLQMNPESVRRQLRRGELRGIKRGNRFRIPESALEESTPAAKAPRRWQQDAERLRDAYARSLANGDELTDFTTAPGDLCEPAPEKL